MIGETGNEMIKTSQGDFGGLQQEDHPLEGESLLRQEVFELCYNQIELLHHRLYGRGNSMSNGTILVSGISTNEGSNTILFKDERWHVRGGNIQHSHKEEATAPLDTQALCPLW